MRWFSVRIPFDFFKSSCTLRQHDALEPLLFLMVPKHLQHFLFQQKKKRLSLLFTYNISKQLIKMFSLILLQREPITTPTAYVNVYGSSTLTQLVSWVTNHKVVDEFNCFCMRVGLVKTIHFVTIDDTSGVPRSINSSNYSTLARH